MYKRQKEVSFRVLNVEQEGAPETAWRRNMLQVIEKDITKAFIPYTQSDPNNKLVSGHAFDKGNALVIYLERPYVDVDLLIEVYLELKDTKAVTEFQIIKDKILSVKEAAPVEHKEKSVKPRKQK